MRTCNEIKLPLKVSFKDEVMVYDLGSHQKKFYIQDLNTRKTVFAGLNINQRASEWIIYYGVTILTYKSCSEKSNS